MKKIKFGGKLSLNKETIANLDSNTAGGLRIAQVDTDFCSNECETRFVPCKPTTTQFVCCIPMAGPTNNTGPRL